MATTPKSILPLPPLEVGRTYRASDFERIEYSSGFLGETRATFRLHLKNGTSIDLPATAEDARHLLVVLCEAFPESAIAQLKASGRI